MNMNMTKPWMDVDTPTPKKPTDPGNPDDVPPSRPDPEPEPHPPGNPDPIPPALPIEPQM